MSINIDRLSALPDAVICHILSFLPTKISVSTSILSKRWRFFWAHVPDLDLDRWTSSSDIISRVLSLHKAQKIDTFRLCYEDCDCSDCELETWITTAILRNVKNVDICLHFHLSLPLCIFTCKTLVRLSLTCTVIIPASTVDLPCLRKLHFIDAVFYAGETLPTLLAGCPVLEELVMESIVDYDLVCCNIFSPSVKRLVVDFQFLGRGIYSDHWLEINAPALGYLRIRDCVSERISTRHQVPESLIEAYICLDCNVEIQQGWDYTVSVLDFVDGLYNVRSLKFSSGKAFSMQLFADKSESIIKFDNLVKFELAADWFFLARFLESADNLRVLIIHEVEENLRHWVEPERVPRCLLSCLETIKIDQLEYTEQEFDMVGYFLKNAQVLKRMEICSREGIDSKTIFEAQFRISSFDRGSDACKLAFC